MHKHVKLKGEYILSLGKVKITVLELTHELYTVGCRVRLRTDSSAMGISNGFLSPDLKFDFTFYLPKPWDIEGWVGYASVDEWEKVKKCVKWFNETNEENPR